jgi:molybdenum cofactor cytidylyltransferase
MTISAIVLAAGESRRMGTQKLLLPMAGKPVIVCIVDELSPCGFDSIIIVTRRDDLEITEVLQGRSVTLVKNPNPAGDMLSSIRCGLAVASVDCDAVMIFLGDQPNITSSLVKKLTSAFDLTAEQIVVPVYDGHRGHPVLIPARLCPELATGTYERGLHSFLEKHKDGISPVNVPDADRFVLEDMDTPQDYERHLQRAACRAIQVNQGRNSAPAAW